MTTLTNFDGWRESQFSDGPPCTMTGSPLRRLQELAAAACVVEQRLFASDEVGESGGCLSECNQRCCTQRCSRGLLLLEHLRTQAGFSVRYAKLGGPLVSCSKQPPDPPRHRILGERRLVHLTQLLQTGLLVLDTQ